MNRKLLGIIGIIAFSFGIAVFGHQSLKALDWNGVDIPGIEYTESSPNVTWMLNKIQSGEVSGLDAQNFKKRIEKIKKQKLLFSLAGLIACSVGLVFIILMRKVSTT